MQYKYHKGSEDDFFGAPEWATICCRGDTCNVYYEHPDYSGRWQNKGSTGIGIDGRGGYPVIAHREPIPEEKTPATITNNSTDQLITERGSRYGKFKDGADIMQSLKDVMRDVDGWNNLTASQKEALDMIQHKIGRILNGDPTYDDSWKDIAGYATLIVNELNGENK